LNLGSSFFILHSSFFIAMPLEILRQVRSIDPTAGTDRIVDVWLENGRVRSIESETEPETVVPEGATVRDCAGLVWGPGLVDLYSRVGEPGNEERETLQSIAQAAAAGGFTRLNLLPNTKPAIDNPAQVQWMTQRVQQLQTAVGSEGLPDIQFWGALTLDTAGEQMCEFAELASGVVGFGEGKAIASLGMLRRLLEYTQPLSKPLLLWMWDAGLAGKGTMRQGVESLKFGLPGIPVMAESVPLAALLELLRDPSVPRPQVPIHIMRVSTARSVELIAQAKAEGLPITASTTWLHLLLDSRNLVTYHPSLRLPAPLGNELDRMALVAAVKSGVIDAIAIDHAAYTYEEKTVAFGEAPAGAIGLQFALPMLWTELVETRLLSAVELWRSLSVQPAHCLGLPPEESWVLLDPQETWTVTEASLVGRSINTHLLGQQVTGQVIGIG
jgi:dihydroorotase